MDSVGQARIEILEYHQREYAAVGDFEAAQRVRLARELLRYQNEHEALYNLFLTHCHECREVDSAYAEEGLPGERKRGDSLISDMQAEIKQLRDTMQRRHEAERASCEESIMYAEKAPNYKFSGQIHELRAKIDKLGNQGQYEEATALQEILRVREDEETKQTRIEVRKAQKKKRAGLESRHATEAAAAEQKYVFMLGTAKTKARADMETFEKRCAQNKMAVTKQHSSDLNKLIKTFKVVTTADVLPILLLTLHKRPKKDTNWNLIDIYKNQTKERKDQKKSQKHHSANAGILRSYAKIPPRSRLLPPEDIGTQESCRGLEASPETSPHQGQSVTGEKVHISASCTAHAPSRTMDTKDVDLSHIKRTLAQTKLKIKDVARDREADILSLYAQICDRHGTRT